MYWLQCRRGLQLTVLVKTYLHVNPRHCSRIFISQEKKLWFWTSCYVPTAGLGLLLQIFPHVDTYVALHVCFALGKWNGDEHVGRRREQTQTEMKLWEESDHQTKKTEKKMHSWKGDRYEQYSLWRLLFFKLCRFRCCFAQNVILKVGVILKYSIIHSLIVFLFVYRTSLCSFFYLTSAVSPAHFSWTRFLSFTYLQFHPARQNMNDS